MKLFRTSLPSSVTNPAPGQSIAMLSLMSVSLAPCSASPHFAVCGVADVDVVLADAARARLGVVLMVAVPAALVGAAMRRRQRRVVERDVQRAPDLVELVRPHVPGRLHADVGRVAVRAAHADRFAPQHDVAREVADARAQHDDALRVGDGVVLEVERLRQRERGAVDGRDRRPRLRDGSGWRWSEIPSPRTIGWSVSGRSNVSPACHRRARWRAGSPSDPRRGSPPPRGMTSSRSRRASDGRS